MEKFQELRDIAKKRITIADHILTQTYPLVQDTKLLLAVIENIFLALTNSMGSILHYERLFKRIPPFYDNFDSKFNMFRSRVVNAYNIDKEHIKFIQDVKDITIAHKKSPIEFKRKDRFVICSDDYNIKEITLEKIKDYVSKTKLFMQKAESIVSKNEEIFGRRY